jgi:hypothetical protein
MDFFRFNEVYHILHASFDVIYSDIGVIFGDDFIERDASLDKL